MQENGSFWRKACDKKQLVKCDAKKTKNRKSPVIVFVDEPKPSSVSLKQRKNCSCYPDSKTDQSNWRNRFQRNLCNNGQRAKKHLRG